MSNFVTFERVVFENLGGFFMDTNFDKKIFIENFKTGCSKVQIKKFNKGDTVTTYIEKRNQICIVLSGEVDLIRYDFNGNILQTQITNFLLSQENLLKYYFSLMILFLINVNEIVIFIKSLHLV